MKTLFVTACALLALTIPVRAQHTIVLFYEDFDSATSVEDLVGWDLGEGWSLDASSPSNGSGFQNLRVAGTTEEPAITPSLDLRRLSDGEISYRARRTSSFEIESIVITASTDGGATFPWLIADASVTLPAGTSYTEYSFALPAQLLGEQDVRIRFDNIVLTGSSANARFDDLSVSGTAKFDVEPPEGLFAAEPGDTDEQSFTLTNYGTTSLEVGAPTLTNAAFSVLPSSALVVPPGETVVYSISFAPAENGVYEGLLELTTVDAGAVTIPLLGLTELNQLAFSLSESSGGESEKDIPVDIRLTFSNADHNLQGIQLSLSWDDDILSLADVLPGLAVAASNWTLSYSVTGSSVKVLLFDETGVGLPAGYYDPIVSLRFDAGLLNNGERDVTLALDEVIGALAVPTADDAELIPWGPDHVLTIEKRFAYFSVDVPDVSFGMVPAGTSVQKSFVVSNLDGERTFDVMALAFIDGPFSVEPGSASIQPDESVEFTVTFEPTLTDFGFFEVDLAIEHDAETDGEYLLPVAGIGIYGRGDNDGDGMVDAMDVIRTVDFILDRTEPTPLQLSLSDIFPFVAGDGTLDVRDLAVTVQGIVRGVWPDDVSLPATYDPEAVTVASKRQSPSSPVRVTVRDEAEQILLNVENDVPLRALQLHLMVQFASGAPRLLLNRDGSPTASGRGEVDVETGIVRVLLYRPDGGVIQPGSYIFAEVPRTASGQVQRLYATAIGQENDRLAVEISGLTAISAPQDDLPRHFSVGQPFPNPFSSGSGGVLRIPVRVPGRSSVELSVYDILGRRVALSSAVVTGNAEIQWDASSSSGGIPPGVYLLRIAVDDRVTTRKIVVTR